METSNTQTIELPMFSVQAHVHNNWYMSMELIRFQVYPISLHYYGMYLWIHIVSTISVK